MNKEKASKNNKGFTLIDVVVAASILALVIIPICSGFLGVAKADAKFREKAEFNRILMNEFDRIKATGEFDGESIDAICEDGTVKTSADGFSLEVTKNERNGKTAYYEFTLTYNVKTPDDTADDISVKGVIAG